MTDEEYLEWGRRHAAIFGMPRDEAITTFLAWRRLFEVASYTVAELNDASDYLAMSGLPCRWPNEQLPVLTRRIMGQRAIDYRKEVEVNSEGELGTCALCGGTGRVSVPHRQGIRAGKWRPLVKTRSLPTYYTEAVLCKCALGRWIGTRIREEKERPTTLAEYETLNPDWWAQLRQRQKEQLTELETEGYPASALALRALLKQRLRGLAEANGVPVPACLGEEREPGSEG